MESSIRRDTSTFTRSPTKRVGVRARILEQAAADLRAAVQRGVAGESIALVARTHIRLKPARLAALRQALAGCRAGDCAVPGSNGQAAEALGRAFRPIAKRLDIAGLRLRV